MKKVNVLILAILMMAGFSLTAQVAVSTNGSSADGSAMLDVQSTTKGFLPPRMTQAQRDGITPVEGLIVFNITTHQPNFHNGTQWMNYDGTSAKTLEIGDNYGGGIIAYILQPGDLGYNANVQHGLIAAASDQSTGAPWGCVATPITGADGTEIGTGNQNTIDIEAGCATAGTAADICANLSLNGYEDWYLPSKVELNKLYLNRAEVGGFESDYYWSSSENLFENAWMFSFIDGSNNGWNKSSLCYVRAIRSY